MSARADAYDRHTGRYGAELSEAFVRFARVEPGTRVLDVGCGTGALTVTLARTAGSVSAADPSEEYALACRRRVPTAGIRLGTAEALPFGDGEFDAVLSQLVVQALDDAPAAAREMHRVTAPSGVAAACVWCFGGGMPLLDAYWAAARAVDPIGAGALDTDGTNAWCTRDGLQRLWDEAGFEQVETGELTAGADYDGFDDAWFSFPAGAGVSGAFCRSLDDRRRDALRAEFRRRLNAPECNFRLQATACAVRGRKGASDG